MASPPEASFLESWRGKAGGAACAAPYYFHWFAWDPLSGFIQMFHACCLHTFKWPEPPCLQICLLQIPIKSGMHLNEGLHQTYQLLLPSANGVIAWQGCPVASTCSLYSPLLFSFVCLRPPFRIYTNSSCLLPAHSNGQSHLATKIASCRFQ